MIILSSPPPRARRRWIFIATGVVSAFGAALIGAVGISGLWDAWGDSDWGGMLSAAFQLLLCAVGMAAAGYQLVEQIASGDPVQRLIATQETLAFKTRAKPAEFLKRVDCVALVREGRGIAMADGTTYMLHAYGAQQADVDAFIDALYDSWWPGLTRTEVRDYLQGLPSPRRKLLLILLGALPVPVFLVVVLSTSISLWLLLGLCLVFLLLSGVFAAALMRLLTRTSGEASYPLFDEDFAAPAAADWEENRSP